MATTNSLPISQLKSLKDDDRELNSTDLFIVSDDNKTDYSSYKLTFEELYNSIHDLLMDEVAENYTQLSGVVDSIEEMEDAVNDGNDDFVLGVNCGNELYKRIKNLEDRLTAVWA